MSTPIPASVPPPAGGFQSKGRARAAANNAKYGTPLPVLLPESPLYAGALAAAASAEGQRGGGAVVRLGLFSGACGPKALVPRVTGTLDRGTQSVRVSDPDDMRVLFERGFFGKGSLSRSEPTWAGGRRELLAGGSAANAEKIREQRRKERKQFKIDRAAAMKAAAVKAEAVLAAKKAGERSEAADKPEGTGEEKDGGAEGDGPGAGDGDGDGDGEAADEDIDTNALTPQTFLVRPTRPDANRNRGKKAFKRRPPAAAQACAAAAAAGSSAGDAATATSQDAEAAAAEVAEAEEAGPSEAELAAQAAEREAAARERAAARAREAELAAAAAELVEEREHLQLSYPEALFLASIGVLQIRDPEENTLVPQGREARALLTPAPGLPGTVATELLPDDPLFVQYAAYAHFRALGWCVRSGVKFCVDWLLYRRGPVFSHSAFSILVVPVYMSAADREASPHAGTDWYAERQSWKWINTVMRVNSLVMKTVIIAYVTIPARESFRTCGGDLTAIMKQYTVREVSLMRFSPARRRD